MRESKTDADKIEEIILLFEDLRLMRPKVFIGDEAPYSVGFRRFLNAFHMACDILMPDNHFDMIYFQMCKRRGWWPINALGQEKIMQDQGLGEEEILHELITLEIETWKLLLDESDHATVDDFKKYARLRDEGKSPEEVYAIATTDGLNRSKRLKMLRQVFQIEVGRIKEVTGGNGGLSYSAYESKLSEYKAMRDEGKHPQAICSTAISDGLNHMQQIRMLLEIFDLSLAEAKEIRLIASGITTSLNAHQEKIAQDLEEAFSDEDDQRNT